MPSVSGAGRGRLWVAECRSLFPCRDMHSEVNTMEKMSLTQILMLSRPSPPLTAFRYC